MERLRENSQHGKITAEIAKPFAESEFEKYHPIQDRLKRKTAMQVKKNIPNIQLISGIWAFENDINRSSPNLRLLLAVNTILTYKYYKPEKLNLFDTINRSDFNV